MTTTEIREPTLLGVLREPQPHVIVRATVSVAVACLLAAAGLFAAMLLVRHNWHLIGLSGASAAWLFALRLIWHPVRGRFQVVRPIFSTLAIFGWAVLLSALLDEGPLVAVIVLLAISLTLYCWASAYVRSSHSRAVHGSDNLVDVRCPQCRYSLVGLTQCRCPECGFAFTIDALIAAQGYGGIHARGETPRTAKSDSAGEGLEGQLAPT